MRKILLVRTDASTQIGTGHVMRCLALAQAWLDEGGRVVFLSSNFPAGLLPHLQEDGIRLCDLSAVPGSPQDAVECAKFAQEIGASWIIVDGYHFNADYQKVIKDQNLRLLFLDDYGHADHYHADMVLNQNCCASEEFYPHKESHTQLLLGPKYVLLRREFLRWREWRRTISEKAARILVTFGGSDTQNVTMKVIQVLERVKHSDLQVEIVVGAGNRCRDSIQEYVVNAKQNYELLCSIDTMAEVMAWADMAISAAGGTCWELAFLGVPSLLLLTAENQNGNAQYMEESHAAKIIGRAADLELHDLAQAIESFVQNEEVRKIMSEKGRQLVDGFGASRVSAALMKEGLFLRPAMPTDCCILWEWANDPVTRAMAINKNPIPLADHVRWFEQKMKNAQSVILILEHDAVPAGQIRFDIGEDQTTEIDIAVAPSHRGRSLGTWLLREGIRYFLSFNQSVKTILGRIREENQSSQRIFEKSGFMWEKSEFIEDGVLRYYNYNVNQ
jgi:UDP-2,4-diacetamido-2,4,6-trideoxy-beta-L-altropyranose hydrolase